MKLGTLLLRDAVVSLNQLEAALRAQVLYGGRLGTNLVELGFIDVDRLAHYLSTVMDVPVATAERFEAVEPNIVLEFGSDLADLYTAFPLGPSETHPGALDVAMADPLDDLAVDQLSTQCGRAIVPHAAAELRVLYYLEKHYGIVRKARYVRDSGAGAYHGGERRRTQPAGGKVAGKVRFEPRPRSRPQTTPPADAATAVDDRAVSAASPVPARTRPPPPAKPGATPAIGGGDPRTPRVIDSRSSPRVQFLDSCAAIDAAKNRDDIADAIVEYAAGRFGLAVMLLLRGSNAIGWRLFAKSSAGVQDAVEKLSLPLDASSVFQSAHDAAHPYRGGPTSAGRPVEKQLWDAVGVDIEPADMLVVPVLVRSRVVNLIYAHGIDGAQISNDYAGELSELGHRASNAYIRLIKEAKAAARADLE